MGLLKQIVYTMWIFIYVIAVMVAFLFKSLFNALTFGFFDIRDTPSEWEQD